jgi:hypothetical protein
MVKPTLAEDARTAAPIALGRGFPIADPESPAGAEVLSLIHQDLRRLHYFLDLLLAGYRSALHPDLLSRSLRGERIALGIDLPELDTVPLWAARRGDGAVAIPFIEFLLARIGEELRAILGRPERATSESNRRIESLTVRIDRIRDLVDGRSRERSDLPRLSDVYLPEGVARELCGPSGIIAMIARECDEFMRRAPARSGQREVREG